MSQYLNFFIRCERQFVPLFSFSRNSYLYRVFSKEAKCEKIVAVNINTIETAKNRLRDYIEAYQSRINVHEREQIAIPSFNNTVEEKLEAIRGLSGAIEELESEISELKTALTYCEAMNDILETARYGDKIPALPMYTEESLLYMGIEISSPKVGDIVEQK